MKKISIILIAVTTIILSVNPAIFADEAEQQRGFPMTEEPEMPRITSLNSELQSNNVNNELIAQRAEWLIDVVEYNENLYGQVVENVVEDSEKYTLYFAPKNIESVTAVYDYSLDGEEEIDFDKWGVCKIEYLKPEAFNVRLEPVADEINTTITIDGTTYEYKFTYYYAWSSGYYRVAKTSWTSYASIGASVLMSFTNIKSILVKTVINRALSSVFSAMDQAKPITAETYNKYFYMNKVCSVKPANSSTWYPTCQIGLRDSFGWCWSTYQKSTGEPILAKEPNPKNANATPPTNYDSQEKKSHYDDGIWMAKKAVEKMTTGGYADVYAVCTTKV